MCRLSLVLAGLLAAAVFVCPSRPAAAGDETEKPRPAVILAEEPPDRPIAVEVEGFDLLGKRTVKKGTLVRLTPERFLFRPAAGSVTEYEAAEQSQRPREKRRVLIIRTTDQKPPYTWRLDDDKAIFEGKAMPPVPLPDITPRPASQGQELTFLFAVLDWQYASMGPGPYSPKALPNLKERRDKAVRYQQRAAVLGGSRGQTLAGLFGAYITTVKKAEQVIDKLSERLKDFRDEQARLRIELAHARLRNAGEAIGEAGANMRAGVDPIWALLGAAAHRAPKDLEDSLYYYTQASTINRAYADEWKKTWEEYSQYFEKAVAAFQKAWGVTDLEKWAEEYQKRVKAGDYEEATRILEKWGITPHRRVLLCLAKSLIPDTNKAKSAVDAIGLARTAVDVAREVPGDELYRSERIMLLGWACQIAYSAAVRELEGKGWGNAYNGKAAYTVHLIDRCLALDDVYDPSGWFREMRAWALMQSGRLPDAHRQTLQIERLRRDEPGFAYNLACLYSCLKDQNQAIEHLKHAITRTGFADVADAKTNPDLQWIRTAKRAEFNRLVEVNIVPQFIAVRQGFRVVDYNIQVTNKSAIPLTQCRFYVVLSNRKRLTDSMTVDVLPPGKAYVWKSALGTPALVKAVTRVGVECDQNKGRKPAAP